MGESDSQQPSRPLAESEFPTHPERIGPYRIEAQVGEGGMGRVYRAREQHPPREVALKLMRGLDPAGQQRFRREAELLAALEHPHIARLYAAGEADLGGLRMPWLAMEFVHGSDVVSHARSARLDLPARIRLLIEIARAVHFAHGRGVIHRDLKPGNILVDAQGSPKILDFGVARLGDDEAGMTQQGQVLGTVPYMSPEQLAGRSREVDSRSDVYALGVIAYELIADRLPYPRLSTSSVMEALEIVQRQAPAELATLQPSARGDLNLVVMKALANEPARRYASAAEFAADLERVLDHRPVEARAPTVGYLISRFVRRHRALSAAASAVLLVLVGATVVSLRFAVAEAEARAVAEARSAEAESIGGFLIGMLAAVNPESGQDREVRVYELLDQARRDLEAAELAPAVRTRLQHTLADTYVGLGQFDTAIGLYESTLSQLPDSLATADQRFDVRVGLWDAKRRAGQVEQAAVELGAALPETASVQQRLKWQTAYAQALAEQGKLDEAVALLRELLALAESELGADAARSLVQRHELAEALQRQMKLDEARELASEVVERRAQVLGDEHVDTLRARVLLAAVLHQQGRAEEAGPLMRRSVEGAQARFGDRHPFTLNARRNLAIFLMQNGALDEAEAVSRALLAALRETRGESAESTLLAKQSLAYVLEDQGRLADAEALLRETVAAVEAAGGASGPLLLGPRNNLGMNLMRQSRHAEALPEFSQLVAEAESTASGRS